MMTVIEQFKADIAYNSEHIQFTLQDDETMGKREQGFYTKFIKDEGHDCKLFIFDNGHRYLLDIEEVKLYKSESIPEESFIHKHLEKIVSDFVSKWELDPEEYRVYCTENEVSARSLIKLHIYREQKIVYLPNILMPMDLRFRNGIGKKLIAQIFVICQRLNYQLVLVQLVESFYNSLQRRNAKIIDGDTVEITENTNLN